MSTEKAPDEEHAPPGSFSPHRPERPLPVPLRPFTGIFRQLPPAYGPFENVVTRQDRSDTFPTCSLSSRLLAKETILKERLQTALDEGAIALPNRYVLSGFKANYHFLSRTEETSFGPVLNALQRLTTLVRTAELSPDANDSTYSLDEDDYDDFQGCLEALRFAAKPSFRAAKKPLPSVPMWGRDSSYASKAYDSSDFEILGACFRREVEHYLKTLVSVHRSPFPGIRPSRAAHEGMEDDHSEDLQDECDVKDFLDQEERLYLRTREEPPHLSLHKESPPLLTPSFGRGPSSASTAPVACLKPEPGTKPIYRDASRYEPKKVSFGKPTDLSHLPSRIRRLAGDPTEGQGRERSEAVVHGEVLRSQKARSTLDDLRLHRRTSRNPSPGDGANDSDDSESDQDGHRPHVLKTFGIPRSRKSPTSIPPTHASGLTEAHFDFKLKMEIVPTWDGSTETLARWMIRVNAIAKKSTTVRKQLGMVVPQRFTGDAEVWYYSLAEDDREECEQDWRHLRQVIIDYFMNRTWVEKTWKQALALQYREKGHSRELPSQYFIRKRELLELVYDNSESELITDIMAGAPLSWRTILTPRLYRTTGDLQKAIKLHEDDLLEVECILPSRSQPATPRYDERPNFHPHRARVNLVGWSKNLEPPKFPKDDSNVSRKATPESKGARPCRHCRSGKHWDPECKYARQGVKRARANFVSLNTDYHTAQEEYDALYYEGLSNSETEFQENGLGDTEGEYSSMALATTSEDARDPGASRCVYTVSTYHPTRQPKVDLQQRTAKVFLGKAPMTADKGSGTPPKELIELERPMARPPGCSFLGATATTLPVRLQSQNAEYVPCILDSGSDITLVSQAALNSIPNGPRARVGQKVKLIQVTGDATINGYVPLDIFFETADGPIKISVEAYVVKGMHTPLILGNDFAGQYSISILREGGETQVKFGDSGRCARANDIEAFSKQDENGRTFQVSVRKASTIVSSADRAEARRFRLQRIRRHERRDARVMAKDSMVLPPGVSK